MIEKISNLPDNVVAFNAKALVTGEDYEKILIPMVEEKLKKFKKLNLLYHLGEEFEKFEPRAMWDDTKVGLMHLCSWNKIAIVTDVSWIRGTSKVFSLLIPAHVKTFANKDLEVALKWVSE
ncbi:MAG: STAS/SEC14 domain-containing protein [Victivallales bacterium]|nr:STAS/SEC14 domain-containing protein [Victivallales bacterium]